MKNNGNMDNSDSSVFPNLYLLYQKKNVTVKSQWHFISPFQTAAVKKLYIWLVILLTIYAVLVIDIENRTRASVL